MANYVASTPAPNHFLPHLNPLPRERKLRGDWVIRDVCVCLPSFESLRMAFWRRWELIGEPICHCEESGRTTWQSCSLFWLHDPAITVIERASLLETYSSVIQRRPLITTRSAALRAGFVGLLAMTGASHFTAAPPKIPPQESGKRRRFELHLPHVHLTNFSR